MRASISARSSNGKRADSDSVNQGSNPCGASSHTVDFPCYFIRAGLSRVPFCCISSALKCRAFLLAPAAPCNMDGTWDAPFPNGKRKLRLVDFLAGQADVASGRSIVLAGNISDRLHLTALLQCGLSQQNAARHADGAFRKFADWSPPRGNFASLPATIARKVLLWNFSRRRLDRPDAGSIHCNARGR